MKRIKVYIRAIIEVDDEVQQDLERGSEPAFIDLEMQLKDKLDARDLDLEDVTPA